jgi:thiol-disulfide isomerase/thioredoxin
MEIPNSPKRKHIARWLNPGTRFALRLFFLLSVGFMVLVQPSASRLASAAGGQNQAASYDEEYAQGIGMLRRQRYEEALKSFKRANELREKKSAESFLGMAQAYLGLEAFKNVIESSDKAIELGASDPLIAAQAYNLKGLALQQQSEGKNQKKLQESEAALRQGLAQGTDTVPMLHYNLGFVLMQQKRDPEGVVELKKYLELQPRAGVAEKASKMIENPRRARESYAPDFSFTTADGEYVSLEDLRGKVVLLDFWGTWCPPCVRSVPVLREMNKKYSKDPAFVMISIATRDEEDTWRGFIAENKMIWRQGRDENDVVQRAFNVRAFPTYMVIDHEGILRFRTTGANDEREAALEDAIRKQLKLATRTAPAN